MDILYFLIGFISGITVFFFFFYSSRPHRHRISQDGDSLRKSQKVQMRLERFEHFLDKVQGLLSQLQGIIGLSEMMISDPGLTEEHKMNLKIIDQSALGINQFLKETLSLHSNEDEFQANSRRQVSLTEIKTPVLVVDDTDLTRETTVAMVKNLGFICESASSGTEAIAKSKAQDFDLILMDYEMPDMNGCTAAQNIRRNSILRKMPKIIAVTAKTRRGDKERMIASGMDDYLSKPYNREQLRTIISKYFEMKNAA